MRPILLKKSINPQDIQSLTKWLSSLVSAHIPITTALEIAEHNTRKPALKHMLHQMKKQINAGISLSDVCKKYPSCFDNVFCHMIQAGEQSGTLDIMLKNITRHQEKNIQLKRTIKKALFYPIIVLIISLAITTALLVFIIPKFADIFQTVGAELPMLTQILITLSKNISNYFTTLLISCLLLFIAIKKIFLKSYRLLIILERLFFNIPILGNILKQSILSIIFNTLSILLHAGIPLTEALHLAAKTSSSKIYEKAFFEISKKVTAGHPIYISIQETHLFPDTVIQMISIGESSSTLNNMLNNLANYFEEHTNELIYNLAQLLEPMIMIFLCAIIGTIIIAMYLPIFKIGTVI